MSSVSEINDVRELAATQLAWRSLLGQTREASFFQSLEWLEAYWQHFGGGQRLRVLVVRSCGRTIGILPLVVRPERTRLGTVRVLSYPLEEWGTFYGPVGPNPAATLLAAMGHVRRTPKDWDLIDLRWIDRDGVDRGRTERAMQAAGYGTLRSVWGEVAGVAFDRSWEAYWASRTSKWRNNVRRSERKLAARADVRFVRHRCLGEAHGDSDPRWDLYEACERVARRSWQGAVRDGNTISHAEVRAFLRDVHLAAARCGAVDMNLLYLGGEPAAFAYNYVLDGRVSGLRMGFDPQVTRDGAGTVLMHRMLRDSFARGDAWHDLGADYTRCKRHWMTSESHSYRLCHYPRAAPRAQLLRAKRGAERWLSLRRKAKAAGK